jgi:uncharacterized membrane protein
VFLATKRTLGDKQKHVLEALERHGGRWNSYKHGWVWDNTSGTKRILDSLVKRGYVEVMIEDNQTIYVLKVNP